MLFGRPLGTSPVWGREAYTITIPPAILQQANYLNIGLYSSALMRHYTPAARAGASATVSCEPGQARKGATAAVDLGAGDLLVRVASIIYIPQFDAAARQND